MNTTDFTYRNRISIIELIPETARARQWTAKNIKLFVWQDASRIAVEPRYFEPIQAGIIEAGMTIADINHT
jgi:hypothetical protein